jgi:YHS domain-containing protein
MFASRWITFAISGALLATGIALRPAVGDDAVKEATCPVMGTKFKVTKSTEFRMVNGTAVYFCCGGCPAAFDREPEKYAAAAGVYMCPVMDSSPAKPTKALRILVNDSYYYMCCNACPGAFTGAPELYITNELKDPVNGKVFKVSAKQPHVEYKDVHYFFADDSSKNTFEKNPDKYARKVN